VNGELAQVIALATHGTSWLRNPAGTVPALNHSNSTFQFVRSVQFIVGSGLLRRSKPLLDVPAWLENLRRRDVKRLWLVVPSVARSTGLESVYEHMLVALSGGGTWFMLSTADRAAESWRASWEVGDRDAPDRRIWDVTYQGSRSRGSIDRRGPSVPAARERLASALLSTQAFAREHELSPWTECFAGALDALDADAPQPPYHPDMLPPDYPAEPRRLAAASAFAWVFGGMGSWNDLGFETPDENEEYHRLSKELYAAVLNGFVAAVNAEL
jgi:hypothetical protein